MAQKHHGMHVERIKAELREKFGPLNRISVTLGLNPNAISAALSHPGRSVKVERLIATLLKKTPYEVFGDERFHSDNTPVSRTANRKPTCRIPDGLRQNGVAA